MCIWLTKLKKNLHVLFYFSYKCVKRAYLKIHSTSKRVKLDTHNALNKTLAKIQYENSLNPSDVVLFRKFEKVHHYHLESFNGVIHFRNDFCYS